MKPRWAFPRPALASLLGLALAFPPAATAAPPSFRGHRIARVYILRRAIFDTSVPSENKRLYRFVNHLHFSTRDNTIRNQLLFKPGDPYDPDLAEETERALRRILRLRDVHVRPMPVGNRRVDVVVETQDTWTTEPYASVSSTGGETKYRFGVRERNLFGLGKQINVSYKKDLDNISRGLSYDDPGLFGTRLRLAGVYEDTDEGSARALKLERPFFSSLTPFAFKGSGDYNKKDTLLYADGDEVARFTNEDRSLGGGVGVSLWSTPRRIRRLGVAYRYEHERLETPVPVPGLETDRVYHYFGPTLEWSRNRFITTDHIRLFSREEDYNMGPTLDLRAGFSSRRWVTGSRNATSVEGVWSRGLARSRHEFALLTLAGRGRYENGWENARQRWDLEYYNHAKKWTTWAAHAAWENVLNPSVDTQLLLGGDRGLRGYPVNAFEGNRLFVANLENRIFIVDDILNFFGLGAAAFADVGYAWARGEPVKAADLRGDYGVGLRLHLSRASLGNVLRFDLAWPTRAHDDGNRSPVFTFATGHVF
ncbi:MAG: BamA/TamA family outer membrane protein [Elusimicrobia bacterium]|nr:BamA/TamA family outer membrane protein [Elusimicrobiota bacterium]